MSEKTKIMLQKCKAVLLKRHVELWYAKKLVNSNQGFTVDLLLQGITDKDISVEEALYISFLVGFQWIDNFSDKKSLVVKKP